MRSTLVLLVATILSSTSIETSKILVAQPLAFKSHENIFVPIIRELSERGHVITYLTKYEAPGLNENVVQIVLDQLPSEDVNYFDLVGAKSWHSAWNMFEGLLNLPRKVARTMFQDGRVRQMLVSDEKYDLVIAPLYCDSAGYPFAWRFKAPLILVSPNMLMPGVADMLGGSDQLEQFPLFPTASFQLDLWERWLNTIVFHVVRFIFHDWHRWTVMDAVRQAVPDCPPFQELEKNISLIFTNTHPAMSRPRTLPPQVIEVGALHCRPPRPLPQELEEFVSRSEAGFIVFAVGTTIKMSDMPQQVMQTFIRVFSQLPHQVVWQWKGQINNNLPPNVKAVEWLPQQDLLGHERCKLFLTHGGLFSLQEAIYHGVPVLGFPFGSDQNMNLADVVNREYGLKLNWADLSEETLARLIRQLLDDPKFARAATKWSFLLKDQPETPLDRAVFWIEHVLRNGGARHLQLASRDMVSYQRAMIDVYAVMVLLVLIMSIMAALVFRMCWANLIVLLKHILSWISFVKVLKVRLLPVPSQNRLNST